MAEKFDPAEWAKNTPSRQEFKSQLDRTAGVREAIETILDLMVSGESAVSVPQIHKMLTKEYGVTLRSTEGVRRWIQREFPEHWKRLTDG